MKIAHLTFSFETGGLQTMLVDILNEQCRQHDVSLIIINDFYDRPLISEIDNRVRVFCLNRKPGSRNPIPLLKLNGLLYRLDPWVVHCHNNELIGLLAPHWYSTCLTVHDVNYPNRYFTKYDKVFAISEAVANDLRQRTAVTPVVIPNGINIRHIQGRDPVRGTSLDVPVFRMVQIGRLMHSKKGQDILLQALAILVHQQGMKRLRLDLIGEGESLGYLKELVSSLDIAPYVSFLGLRSREFIYAQFRSYDLLVQPSRYEGFGLTVAEAMAAGVPVLVSDIEGPMEIIQQGVFGWHFPVGDAAACARQIAHIQAVYETEAFRQKIRFAREHAQKSFSVTQTARQYVMAY
nr:glycosyltransferase [uncultured Arsenicibacter sp.]